MVGPAPVLDPASLVIPAPDVELRYRFEPGQELTYRSTLAVFRSSDASPRFSSKSKEEFTSSIRLKVLAQDLEDQGYYLLAYHQPLERLVDGQPAPTGANRIVYYKHTPLGVVLEASDPMEATTLLLPAPAVGPASEWRVVQQHHPAGRSQSLEVVSLYRLNARDGFTVQILFDAQELRYQGDTAATEGNVYTLTGKGRFDFEYQAGHLLGLETESTMTSKEEDLLLEVVAVHTMALVEEEAEEYES